MKRLIMPTVALALLASCGPMSPERAADECQERARDAAGPRGELGIGVNSGGKVTPHVEIGITSDYLRGADPYQVYEDCVRQKTGQGPIRPLEL